MKPLAQSLTLVVTLFFGPVQAEESVEPPVAGQNEIEEGLDLLGTGAQRLLEHLFKEMEPALEDLGAGLGAVVDNLDSYHAPEFLPNGDIILRRKTPLPPATPPEGTIAPNDDGSLDI